MEQDAVGTPSGLESFNDPSGLRIDDGNGIAIEQRCEQEPSIGRSLHISDKVLVLAGGFRNHRERARRCQLAVLEVEFKDTRLGSAAHINLLSVRRHG